jgi:alpha-D-ribose 1-methylphosphonate 5-triphosphate synthase subunit PhnH
VAAGSLALTLLDGTTPVHLAGALDCAALRDWLTFHTGAPIVGAAEAVFAFGTWDALQPVTRFAIGTAEYPDRAATLVIECAALTAEGPRLSGPRLSSSPAAPASHSSVSGSHTSVHTWSVQSAT